MEYVVNPKASNGTAGATKGGFPQKRNELFVRKHNAPHSFQCGFFFMWDFLNVINQCKSKEKFTCYCSSLDMMSKITVNQ